LHTLPHMNICANEHLITSIPRLSWRYPCDLLPQGRRHHRPPSAERGASSEGGGDRPARRAARVSPALAARRGEGAGVRSETTPCTISFHSTRRCRHSVCCPRPRWTPRWPTRRQRRRRLPGRPTPPTGETSHAGAVHASQPRCRHTQASSPAISRTWPSRAARPAPSVGGQPRSATTTNWPATSHQPTRRASRSCCAGSGGRSARRGQGRRPRPRTC